MKITAMHYPAPAAACRPAGWTTQTITLATREDDPGIDAEAYVSPCGHLAIHRASGWRPENRPEVNARTTIAFLARGRAWAMVQPEKTPDTMAAPGTYYKPTEIRTIARALAARIAEDPTTAIAVSARPYTRYDDGEARPCRAALVDLAAHLAPALPKVPTIKGRRKR